MQLKTVEVEGNTYAVIQDGKPVFVHDDGQERPFDAKHTAGQIKSLNHEAMERRKALEAAEEKLNAFTGIDDPEVAKKAMETVKNLSDKNLVDAGDVEKLKAETISAMEAKYKPVVDELDAVKGDLRKERIGGSFSRSQFIGEKLAIPSDMVEATFGRHFEAIDGKVQAKDASGNVIYSKERPGEPAGFEEAIQVLVDQYPSKDSILKGTQSSGADTTIKKPGAQGTASLRGAGDRVDRQKVIAGKFPDLPQS